MSNKLTVTFVLIVGSFTGNVFVLRCVVQCVFTVRSMVTYLKPMSVAVLVLRFRLLSSHVSDWFAFNRFTESRERKDRD